MPARAPRTPIRGLLAATATGPGTRVACDKGIACKGAEKSYFRAL
ncbi:hypothetical protein MAA5396_00771 [Marinovum algicola]|jgi:hypothetical protein|uniref:Uncharacterized protein n=1 Tax=Marinovum algicola TaxID=42444 RepID=A0A975W8K5_9RHOB|nr:hypothetical protein MALG_01884 [Marinovum algicola DG 898]SEJ11551.1 hypothetical protein SAMN04487940_103258 [Marinovum algicola]SLN21165.1 hypothetical protein MAA5396_00771 [Marinovum algicola]